MHFAAEVSYDGSRFSGWQIQPNAPTVQKAVEDSLKIVHGGQPVHITAAGRTDAGVHARGQVISFTTPRTWAPFKLRRAINANLPEGAVINRVREANDDFDARRSAEWREYAYFVWRASFCYPYIKPYVWWNAYSWDDMLIRRACAELEGEHDFRAFCRVSECPANSVRRLHFVRYIRRGHLSIFRVRGNAFLMNMVRIMIGNLDSIGQGKMDLNYLRMLLGGASRVHSAKTAPPTGLFFWRVGYDSF